MSSVAWSDDDPLDGFAAHRIDLGVDRAGPLAATLVRRTPPQPPGGVVLYLHGFVDYFFQSHVADVFLAQGWAFYALDLRRHGRSLLPHQMPNACRDLDEYHDEIDTAIDIIDAAHPSAPLVVMGHSTGGLIAALYADHGTRRGRIDGVVLNSPFLAFHLPLVAQAALPVAGAAGSIAPWLRVGQVRSAYGASIHASEHGEWSYDLRWKPLQGFPVRAGWIRAIRAGQRRVRAGLSVEVPVLVLRSDRSLRSARWRDELRAVDSVLSVDDIARLAPCLGGDVRVVTIAGALHDVTLSSEPVRRAALDLIVGWCRQIAEQAKDRSSGRPLSAR